MGGYRVGSEMKHTTNKRGPSEEASKMFLWEGAKQVRDNVRHHWVASS